MNSQIFKTTALLSIMAAIIVAPFYRNVAAGLILGTLFSFFNLSMLANSFNAVMKSELNNPFPVIFTNMFRLFLLAVPMYIAVKFPAKISIIGIGAGMILFLPALVINTIREEKNQ